MKDYPLKYNFFMWGKNEEIIMNPCSRSGIVRRCTLVSSKGVGYFAVVENTYIPEDDFEELYSYVRM